VVAVALALALVGLALSALGAWWALGLRARQRDIVVGLCRMEDALRSAEETADHAEEGMAVLAALLVDRGVLEAPDIAEARERLVDGPRRKQAEREEMLRGISNSDEVQQRLVSPPDEWKH
jgi:hypothetical protein